MSQTGETLRKARESAGISLARMAVLSHFSKGHLSNVEAGRRTATPDVVTAYEQVLGDHMRRRGLITGLAAGVVAPAAVSELIHRGFTAALGAGAGEEQWRERADSLGRDYMSVGAAELQDRLAGDLVVLQQHLGTPAMWGLAARFLSVYGKTTGEAREAIRWYRMAAVAADRSDDTDVRVWVRGRAALALGYEGVALGVSDDLADQAIALADRPSLGRLNALMAKAHVAGVRGDHRDAVTHLDAARRVFDRTGSTEQISDFAVPEWRMATFTSMLLSRLGDPGAVEAQEWADRTRPASLPRFATHIELHRGLLLVKSGDQAEGVRYARSALAGLPAAKHSQSLRLILREVERAAA
ncbi:helix-turn-helix transcriptional regulator [Solwaraspora sp. WMMD406]|uniref:helix-turn-helix domain-containing protein n=1 Tax=Solwaraspora sp. WMMD406 TaxID=3016095 RepID=UPI002416761D|nr:helix-turn-helix transcriptional regulator [Solwaraspora sp. WMMD406]MDG4763847.1 helix-turn-helix transcriptional regulator [Solwaraspora sp. WMMD406]